MKSIGAICRGLSPGRQPFKRLQGRLLTTSILVISALAPETHGRVAFTNLVSFNGTNGANPWSGLIQGSDGNFYGTTLEGGPNGAQGYGTVFQMALYGTLTTILSFKATDGNLYGTIEGGGTNGGQGTVFRMTPDGVLTTLVSFSIGTGRLPRSGLVQGTDGNGA